MGARGPARKPTNLALLHGDRPSRVNTDEPKPRDRPTSPPGWMSALAREEWDRIAPDLVVMGTAKAVDATALAAYCEAAPAGSRRAGARSAAAQRRARR